MSAFRHPVTFHPRSQIAMETAGVCLPSAEKPVDPHLTLLDLHSTLRITQPYGCKLSSRADLV
jgi:hypothetical protein